MQYKKNIKNELCLYVLLFEHKRLYESFSNVKIENNEVYKIIIYDTNLRQYYMTIPI